MRSSCLPAQANVKRQRLQKEEDRRTIEELHSRLSQLECERSDLERRVELLQKVRLRSGGAL